MTAAGAIQAVCIGEAMVELSPVGGGLYAKGYAGDAYNTAVYLRRALGDDGEVAFLTAIGDDVESAGLLAAFEAERLSNEHVFVRPGRSPGLYMIERDEEGERSFHYWRSASAARDWLVALEAAGGAAVLKDADLVYLSGISLAILSAEDCKRAVRLLARLRGETGAGWVAFDPNIRLRLWTDRAAARETIEAAAALAEILLPSYEDGLLMWGEEDPAAQLDRWSALGPREIALTLSAGGVLVRSEAADRALAAHTVPQVVDTSGAGDSFNGAYLAARLQGAEPIAAAEAGLANAALAVASPGALVGAAGLRPGSPGSPS